MRDERQFLEDIVTAAETISKEMTGITYSEFLQNQTLQRSVLFSFAVIGEAANKLSKTTQEAYPEVEWNSIIAFRNIIVHAYFSLNLKTVFSAAKRRVLPLAEQVKAIIRHDFSGEE